MILKKRCNARLLLLLFYTLAPSTVLAIEKTASSLLEKVVSSQSSQSYKASAVYIRPSGMESIDIEHDGDIERITFAEGSPQEVSYVRWLDNQYIYSMNTLVHHKNSIHFNALAQLSKHLDTSLQRYDLFISQTYDQVAGRQAVRLSVISKNNDRYSYVFWVDVVSYVILRTDILSENGELIERMLFTSFAIKEPGHHANVPLDGSAALTLTHSNIIDNEDFSGDWLPTGFGVLSTQSIYNEKNELAYQHLKLSDGFAVIDIYRGKKGNEAKITRGQQLDAFHAYKGIMRGEELSVEGRLPYDMLKKTGLALEQQP